MIDEVFRNNKTDQKIVDADERFLKISPLPDGSKVVDAKSSRIAYVADPKDDKDAINKSWAVKYFKKEKDAITKLGESATAKSVEIDSKAKEVINTSMTALTEIKAIIDNFKGKQTELNVLKTNLEVLKTNLETLAITGLINDNTISTTTTYSSKKVEDLVSNTKTTLTTDIKSKTDSLTTIVNNQKQSITTLDGKINTTQSNLNNFASGVSGALAQKVDAMTYNTFATKVTNDLSNKANKTDVPSVTSLEATLLKKINAYTKAESDGKFALKTELQKAIPVGSYLLYSSNTNTPDGFLRCDGSALDKTAYAALFAVIGYTYGRSGDKFLLPNFSDGKFMRGIGGKAAALGTVQQDAIRNITAKMTHNIGETSSQLSGAFKQTSYVNRTAASSTPYLGVGILEFDASLVVPTANENRPLNMSVVVLIKY